MAEYKPVRLIKAAKTFNVGTGTITEFLKAKGFEVEEKPTTKLDADMYTLLLKEFGDAKMLKEEAEAIQLGSKNKNVKLELAADGSTKTVEEEFVETKKVELTGPKIVGNLDLDKKKEVPKKVEEVKEEPVKEDTPTKAEEKPVAKKKTEKTEDVMETKMVELSGPKILGSVDLSAKKKAPKKTEKTPVKTEPTKNETPVVKEEQKTAPVTKKKKEEPKEDFLATKRVSLTGPKIMGKIEIKDEPKQKKDKPSDGPKRTRKRIRKPSKIDPRKNFRNDKKKPIEKTVVSEKEIEEKLKATMAKLQAASGGKNQRQKVRRAKRQGIQEAEKVAQELQQEQDKKIKVTEFITVSDLATMLETTPTDIITKCFSLGVMVSINQRLDAEIIELIVSEYDYEIEFISAEESEEFVEEEDAEEDLEPRAPIVTIMGHVDHGKTSLLDYIREANVVAKEAGGITQHIGAYEVSTEKGNITFLDTPGHEAFTAMRARGAKLTDVAVIVIAADDDIMPQTKEAISHAQSANVPMVFAINKIDKPNASPDRIKEKLSAMNPALVVEEWGGEYQSQDISAKTGLNIDLLLEKIALQAELLELKANPDKAASGVVIEASLDKGRGYVATILVQGGSLHVGDFIVAGAYSGKVKAMTNHKGEKVTLAGPATPVQILGLDGAPAAGERFKMFESEQDGKAYASRRNQLEREHGLRTQKHITLDEIGRRLALGTFKELNVIVKGDVDGSIEALSDSLLKLSTEEIQINILHKAVGGISESDIMLASASDAIIIGFQVRPSSQARRIAETEGVEIRLYSVIYQAIEELKAAMEGMLEPTIEEKIQGLLEVQEVFKITKVGTVAGCIATEGKVKRDAKLRVIRDGIVVYSGGMESLRRFKDEVKEVINGQDCGVKIKNFNDIKKGDILEAYEEIEIQRTL